MNSVYSNAAESCNGLDDDCDGNTDEEDAIDKQEWFEDLDSDGFGNGGVSQFACNAPAGLVCYQGIVMMQTVLFLAVEVCNGYDDNCDGLTDDVDADSGFKYCDGIF